MAIAVGFMNIVALLLNGIHNFMYEKIDYVATGQLKQMVFEKAGKIQPICFEDSSKIDCIEKADQGIKNIFSICMTMVTIISFYIPYFVMTSVYLYKLSPNLTLALIIIFIPVIISQIFKYKIFDRLIDNGIKSIFKVLTILGYVGVLLLLTKLYLNKAITVGAFASVFTSVRTMYNLMNELFGTHIGNIVENFSSVKKFKDFMNLPEVSEQNRFHDIDIKNLYFKYPGSQFNALSNINLHISKGEVVALVGTNGSGKSTLAKIIATIYQSSQGDTRLFSNADISMIFQDYKKYKLTLSDNVRIGDFDKITNQEEIKELITEAGIGITMFNKMKETILSPEFGGIDFSGGQWQRIAIARALYKPHKLIILDEPTAAINPLEESRIFEEFIKIVKGKTALLITHRLGSVKIANRIIVMKNGRIIEDDNFQSLMELKGEFYHLYNTQSKFYK